MFCDGDPKNGTPPEAGLGLAVFSAGTAGLSSSVGYSAKIQIKNKKPGISTIKQVYGAGGVWTERMFTGFGYAIGSINAMSLYQNQQSLETRISYDRYIIEQGVNAFSAAGGVPGAIFGLSWETARVISKQPYYRENVRPKLQEMLGIHPDEYMRCMTCGGNKGWIKN